MNTPTIQRFYNLFVPQSYQIDLTINESQLEFSTKVKISGSLAKGSEQIKLHAVDLDITKVQIQGKDVDYGYHDNALLIQTEKSSEPIEIYIESSGKVKKDNLHGLYASYSTQQQRPEDLIITTQMEANHCREMIPCVDEPEAKAIFQLDVTCERDLPLLSNTTGEKTEVDGGHKHSFKTTPKMSPYLLAVVGGDFKNLSTTTKSGVKIKIWAQPRSYKDTQFALDTAVACVEYFEEYFDIDFPLEKLDLIAIPDFNSGAMENWGCTTYRETALIFDENSSIWQKKLIAEVVCHEISHHWFGNLVTMRWWNDLWLNESFATFASYIAADTIYPQLDMWMQFFSTESSPSLSLDSLRNSHPIEVEVRSPEEIRTIFDAISYGKGASVIRMLHQFIGGDAFRAGVQEYLKSNLYSNAESDDLWRALDSKCDEDILPIMHSFTRVMGFPEIKVSLDKSGLEISQKRFLLDEVSDDQEKQPWNVPLTINDENLVLSENNLSIDTDQDAFCRRPVIDKGASTFSLVEYSPGLLDKILSRDLDLNELERLKIITSQEYFFRRGDFDIKRFAQISAAMRSGLQSEYLGVCTAGFAYYNSVFDSDEENRIIRKYASDTFAPIFDEAKVFDGGLKDLDPEMQSTLTSMASLSWDDRFEPIAHQQFKALIGGEGTNPNIIGSALATTIRTDEGSFDIAWKKYLSEKNINLKSSLSGALMVTRKPEQVALMLDAIKDPSKIRSQDAFIWIIRLLRSRKAKRQTLDWVISEWDWIDHSFRADLVSIAYIVKSMGTGFSDQPTLDRIEKFYSSVDMTGLERETQQSLEVLRHRIAVRNKFDLTEQ